jgi:uncharacterized protein (TIGR02452 family)
MARILYLFERQGARSLVLGSFGTGVFKNDVAAVARVWRSLLTGGDAPFRTSFDRIMFAVFGRETYEKFVETFEGYI